MGCKRWSDLAGIYGVNETSEILVIVGILRS
jgi:hypothetical protein